MTNSEKTEDHYYSKTQTSAFRPEQITVQLKEDTFTLISASGLFSKSEMDFGTKLLIEHVTPVGKTLDLGCGYGVIGISFLRRHNNITVTLSDVNSRAVEITKENLKTLKLDGKAVQSDIFENIDEQFDTIVTNPPYAAGRAICYAMIDGARAHLNRGGQLYVVARHAKGGKMLEKKMKEVFGNVKTVTKRGGFRVYASKN